MRWTFYASVLVCVCLAVLKTFSWTVAPALAAAAIGIPALAAVGIQAARRFSRRDCAILLDRKLGLDERLSSALDAGGPMADALRRDAERAWTAADPASAVPPVPVEAKWLAGALLFVAALLLSPALVSAPEALDPELAAVASREAKRLRESGNIELRGVAEMLEAARTPEEIAVAVARLRTLEAQSSGKGTETEAGAASSGTALSAALAKHGSLPADLAVVTPALDRKLQGVAEGIHASRPGGGIERKLDLGPVENVPAREAARKAVARHAWDPEYDDIVHSYYEVKR